MPIFLGQDLTKVHLAVGADKAALEDDNVTYLMNGQSLEALAFRVVSAFPTSALHHSMTSWADLSG